MKLIYDEEVFAVILERIAFSIASKLAAAAEFHYRLDGVGLSCEDEHSRGLTRTCCI
jgi:hypothetical protein